jgi:hypothetical protein
MDPDTRRLMLFAGGLGTILAILIGTSAIVGHRSNDVPVITADTRPIRIKPENPGGMKINGAENDIFSGGADNKDARLAAAAENPDTAALTTADTPPVRTRAPEAPAQAAAVPMANTPPVQPPVAQPLATQPRPAAVAVQPPQAKQATVAKPPTPPRRPVSPHLQPRKRPTTNGSN